MCPNERYPIKGIPAVWMTSMLTSVYKLEGNVVTATILVHSYIYYPCSVVNAYQFMLKLSDLLQDQPDAQPCRHNNISESKNK